MNTEIMTIIDVARYLRMNAATIYRYIQEGKLPAARLGRNYRVRREDVERFFESRKVAAWDRVCSDGKELSARAGWKPEAVAPAISEYRRARKGRPDRNNP